MFIFLLSDFRLLHGRYLNNEPNIKKLGNIFKHKINNITEDVIKCIVRTRTYIRINNLNKYIVNKNNKDKSKQKFTK